jgi:hypothetical protein
MKAAYFREEWLDKATQLLPNLADRAIFYEMLMQRAFGRQIAQCSNPVVVAMFTMAESAIAADIEKYEAKCERNRANALAKSNRTQSLPVAASGCDCTQSQPSTSTSTSTTTTTSTNTSTNTTSISQDDQSQEKEIYLIYYTLFNRGALNVQEEFNLFWNYYEALGWKNNKGAQIVSKVSAASMWRMQGEVCANLAERQSWARAFKNCAITSPLIFTSFNTLKVEVTDDARRLIVYTSLTSEQINKLEDTCERNLRALMREYNCTELTYYRR